MPHVYISMPYGNRRQAKSALFLANVTKLPKEPACHPNEGIRGTTQKSQSPGRHHSEADTNARPRRQSQPQNLVIGDVDRKNAAGKMLMNLLEAVTRASKTEPWQGAGDTDVVYILIAGIVKLLLVLPCSLTVEGCHRARGHQRLSGQCRSMRLRHFLLALALCIVQLGACASEPRTSLHRGRPDGGGSNWHAQYSILG
jgi:hypothetical protein